ncbi:MAG: cobyrinate a,c-diamide synthase [Nitrospirota bacterium]|nr:cobyrinate a,c-diamide synthase [Nitrospirota bacterium]
MKTKSRYPRLVISGLKGGSGKTILSMGLISAWSENGLKIGPYKKGPDYIDAGWLSAAAGHACYNLDPFLISREKILASFAGHFGNSDCAVIEGNRGLYDGMDSSGTYSTAELAKILGAPVILIVDCTKMTRTAAAMILGMQRFDRRVDIRGVVLNRIAGARHEKVIREAVEKYCKIPVLGSIPKLGNELLSERHMGLTPFQEHADVGKAISDAAEIARKYLDIKGILRIAEDSAPLASARGGKLKYKAVIPVETALQPRIKIGIIRDSAFQFYYPENFEELGKRGAELLDISSLERKKLPEIDALYIGGGFPETHAILLARNSIFRKSLRKAVEDGLPVYAECGGLMYLGDSLVLNNRTYPMAGVFPVRFCLEKKPQAHGYTIVEVNRANPFYKRGTVLRGHEFHYSRVLWTGNKEGMRFVFKMRRGHGVIDGVDGLSYKKTLATYTHLHALGSPEWADGLINQAHLYAKRKARSAK